MKKLKVGFWGFHHCSMLKHYCNGANALTRERQELRAGSELESASAS